MAKKFSIPWSKPAISSDEQNAVNNVFESGWLSQGKITQKFEKDLSQYFKSNVIMVNNGTSSIICALLAHGIKPGDSVIVPDFTFFATFSAAKILGANIILADIDKETYNLTPDTVEKIVQKKDVKYVIPVDVAGVPIDIQKFEELSKKYNFTLIEDAAEALGSEYNHQIIGSFNHTSTFSFHIAKQITTIEGGCVTSKNPEISKRLFQIRDHGRSESKNYQHEILGSNFRITDLQSSIGIKQLEKIEKFLERRNQIAEKYKSQLSNVTFQEIPSYSTKNNYMMFFVKFKNSDSKNKAFEILTKNDISVKTSWPPIHSQPINFQLKSQLNSSSFKNSIDISNTTLMLPIYNEMTDDEAQYVIDNFNSI